MFLADIDSENIHRYPNGGSCDLPDSFELYAEAPPSIPSDLFCRKMLPVAALDYELKALGIDGVAGSGTSPF